MTLREELEALEREYSLEATAGPIEGELLSLCRRAVTALDASVEDARVWADLHTFALRDVVRLSAEVERLKAAIVEGE